MDFHHFDNFPTSGVGRGNNGRPHVFKDLLEHVGSLVFDVVLRKAMGKWKAVVFTCCFVNIKLVCMFVFLFGNMM